MVIRGVKDFPAENEFVNPTVEVIDKALNALENSINSIQEELYGQGYIQSEVAEIVKRLEEADQSQKRPDTLEETLATIKRKVRQQPEITPYEPPPVSSILEAKSNKELVDDIKNILIDEFKDIFGDERGSFSINELPPDKRESPYQKLKPLMMELIRRAREKYQARYNRDVAAIYIDGSVDSFDDKMRDAVMYSANRYMDEEG